jgi:hypothetical protein
VWIAVVVRGRGRRRKVINETREVARRASRPMLVNLDYQRDAVVFDVD